MNLNLKDMVDEMYQDIESEHFHELESSRFTVTIPANDLAFYDAISEKFQKSRTEIVSGILSQAALGILLSLRDSDLDEVSSLADKKYIDHCNKVYDTYEQVGLGKWANYAESLKESRKNADS